MIKLFGAFFIVLSASIGGYYKASQLARRPQQIRQLIQALQRLETEIHYGYTPLPEALIKISESLRSSLSALFRQAGSQLEGGGRLTAKESWQGAVSHHWPNLAMKANEREILLQMGFTLGVSDREDQIKHLRLTISELQSEEDAAREEQNRYEKMWKSLGVLGGVLVAILMY